MWPYAALGAIGIAIGAFFFGHHEGTLEGDAQVASIKQQISENNAKFAKDIATEKQKEQNISDKAKQDLSNEQLKHKLDVATLSHSLDGMRKQSNSYVTTIERLQGDAGKTACNAALELANRQYNELADALVQTSDRADNAAAIANTLNAYTQGTRGTP